MGLRLFKYGFSEAYAEPGWFNTPSTLKPSYDVVIIGAGGHGLATAYYLAREHGITNVAVLDQSYIGGGNTGRNTTIIRSNYLTPEGVRFYDASLALFRDLSTELPSEDCIDLLVDRLLLYFNKTASMERLGDFLSHSHRFVRIESCSDQIAKQNTP